MRRTDAFSYRCNACGRCCRGKRIQTSPFEIAALARHLGVSTGEFIRRFSDEAIPVYLRWRDGNQCIFFDEARGCTVHPARPLVCRLYPLGRMTEADGSERFQAVTPHPQSQGVYGDDGTVADWLDSQGLAEYLDEVDRYSLLVRELVRQLQGSEGDEEGSITANVSWDLETHWLDVDLAVETYCARHGVLEPTRLEERTELHRRIICEQLGLDWGTMAAAAERDVPESAQVMGGTDH